METLVLFREKMIAETLLNILNFRTPSGYFKTFRTDYSKESCPSDYIDEENALLIETVYDHSFIMDVFVRMQKYFPCKTLLLETVKKGLDVILNDAIIENKESVRWRYYNINHQGKGMILPDIDDTGRVLIFIERLREIFGDFFLEESTPLYNDLINPNNYRQYWSLLHPVNSTFKPENVENPEHHGLLTHFGNKENNDVDPVCNIIALSSALMYFDKNFLALRNADSLCIKKVIDYLFAFLSSDICAEKTHEYYEPVVVFYNFAKLINLCENLRSPMKNIIKIDSCHKKNLSSLVIREIKDDKCKNCLEKSFAITSLLLLGSRNCVKKTWINEIIENNKGGYWDAYRFYRQRHPHRIFGSRSLTSAVCLEMIDYFSKAK